MVEFPPALSEYFSWLDINLIRHRESGSVLSRGEWHTLIHRRELSDKTLRDGELGLSNRLSMHYPPFSSALGGKTTYAGPLGYPVDIL